MEFDAVAAISTLNNGDGRKRRDVVSTSYAADGADHKMEGWLEISAWRRSRRHELIRKRLAMPVKERDEASERIRSGLDAVINQVEGRTVSVYWPIKGEPNLYPWIKQYVANGGQVALPVVVAKGRPLEFRKWAPGDPLARGVWNIPIPERQSPVQPDIVIVPLVGFDGGCFRLGYGGGCLRQDSCLSGRIVARNRCWIRRVQARFDLALGPRHRNECDHH